MGVWGKHQHKNQWLIKNSYSRFVKALCSPLPYQLHVLQEDMKVRKAKKREEGGITRDEDEGTEGSVPSHAHIQGDMTVLYEIWACYFLFLMLSIELIKMTKSMDNSVMYLVFKPNQTALLTLCIQATWSLVTLLVLDTHQSVLSVTTLCRAGSLGDPSDRWQHFTQTNHAIYIHSCSQGNPNPWLANKTFPALDYLSFHFKTL